MNPKIRVCSKRTFSKASHHIFKSLWRWAERRHLKKGSGWIQRKYFRSIGHRNWVFFATIKDAKGRKTHLDLVEISNTPIKRHIKIKADANPYDPTYQDYFAQRLLKRKEKRLSRPCSQSWSAWWEITAPSINTEAG